MAIDVSLFGADIPAGTYTKGDRVPLGIVAGPEIVRSGRGAAILKRITSLMVSAKSGSISLWKVSVKNSDWVDPAMSYAGFMISATTLDRRTGAVQNGHDCALTPNSAWEVYAECCAAFTTTEANSIACLIEIDYPSVSAITQPDNLQGFPTSINTEKTITLPMPGSITTSKWDVFNVDIFKAGFEYALEKVELSATTYDMCGFIAISGAAGMGGLTRIVPICNRTDNIRPLIEYATKLVKGPMDLKFLMFGENNTTPTTDVIDLTFDFVKRRI